MFEDIPLGVVGNAGGIGVLTIIIIYLLRQLTNTRKDDAVRLIAIDRANDERLKAEREARTEERTWLRSDLDRERERRERVEAQLENCQDELIAHQLKQAKP